MTKAVSIQTLKAQFQQVTDENDPLFDQFAADPRKGVQALIQKTQHHLAQIANEKRAFQERFFMKTKHGNVARSGLLVLMKWVVDR